MLDTVLVAAVSVAGGFLVAHYTRNREERWTRTRDVERDQREAYRDYLVAQQALRDEIEVRRQRMAPATDIDAAQHDQDAVDHDADVHERSALAQTEVWRESGSAEMNARLAASDKVFDAINLFENFADSYTSAYRPRYEPPGNWEHERTKLIKVMRAELTDHLADAPRGRARRAIARLSFRRPRDGAARRVSLPIETARLTLRAYDLDDVDDIHALLYGDAEVRRYTGGVSTKEETRLQIERYIDAHRTVGYAYWAVAKRDSGTLVGEAGLKPLNDVGPELELGYAFGKKHWRRGYAIEAASAILDAAHAELGLQHVFATVEPDNAHSRRVLSNLGFSPAGSTADRRLLCFRVELPRATGRTA